MSNAQRGATLALTLRTEPASDANSIEQNALKRTPPRNRAASYSRFSSDLQRPESITDQQRVCREHARKNGHRISKAHEYADEAVSGTRHDRAALDAMLRDAGQGQFYTVYFHNLSRLARDYVLSMTTTKRLRYRYGIRVISVSDGIDSDREGWDVVASIMAVANEQYSRDLAANVRRGQEGVMLAGYSVGDYPFGYRSQEVHGSEQQRRGRNQSPFKRIDIDDVESGWVLRIFAWFVHDRKSLRWITRKLNCLNAPKDHRASTKDWTRENVVSILTNPKYIGTWPWNQTETIRDPETGKVRHVERPEEEREKWIFERPELAFLDKAVFHRAQEILDANYKKYASHRKVDGTFTSGVRAVDQPRRLLSGLLRCADCKKTLIVGGSGGKYMLCPRYGRGTCRCQTQLRRDRAEKMILGKVAERITSCPKWFDAVYQGTVRNVKKRTQEISAELESAQRTLAELDERIGRLVDRIEVEPTESAVVERLASRRIEHTEVQNRIRRLHAEAAQTIPEPTEEWVRKMLSGLHETLQSGGSAAAFALRDLVGGEILVTEIRTPGRKRFYLQGRFRLAATSIAMVLSGLGAQHGEGNIDDEFIEEIVIDFVDPNPLDAKADRAKELYDEGLLCAEIAEQLGCARSSVTKLLRHWAKKEKKLLKDGRARRKNLNRKWHQPPMYQRVSDEVKRLYDEGFYIQDIAHQLKCDRNTVAKALKYWYTSRDLDVPPVRPGPKPADRKD